LRQNVEPKITNELCHRQHESDHPGFQSDYKSAAKRLEEETKLHSMSFRPYSGLPANTGTLYTSRGSRELAACASYRLNLAVAVGEMALGVRTLRDVARRRLSEVSSPVETRLPGVHAESFIISRYDKANAKASRRHNRQLDSALVCSWSPNRSAV